MRRLIGTLWILPLLLLACTPTPQEPRLTRIEIEPPGLLLTGVGDNRVLVATAFNQYGEVMDLEFEWSSSKPEFVVVEEGTVTAAASVGSSVVVASVGSFDSAPVTVVVAELVPEAVVLSDAQIIGEVEAVDDTQAFGPGFRFTVRLQGVEPDVGSVLVAAEAATLVGRVVSVAGDVVELEVVPLDEVVVAMELEEELLDMTFASLQFLPEVEATFDIDVAADGSVTLDLKPGVMLSGGAGAGVVGTELSPQAVQEFDLGPLACEAEGVLEIDLVKATFVLKPNLSLDAAWNSSVKKLVVGGQPTVTYSLRPVLSAALNGKVDCKVTLAEPKIPLPGFLGFFLGGVIPLGVGFELGGSLPVPEVGVDVQGSIAATISAGFVCPADAECSFPREFELSAEPPKVVPVVPATLPGVKVELSAFAYAFAGLEAGITSKKLSKAIGTAVSSMNGRIRILVVKGGLKLSAKLAHEDTQVEDPLYSSEYGVSFEAAITAGKSIQAFFDLVKLNAFTLSFQLASVPLASSPKMLSMSLDVAAFEAGDEVVFTVNLDPATLQFLGSHNVDAVRVYRVAESGGLVLVNESQVGAGQQSVVVPWVASLDSAEGMRFVAFVRTSFFPPLRLELGQLVMEAEPVANGEIHVSWREVRDYDETIKPHETPSFVISGGFLRSEAVQELSAVIQVEVERVGDDLIFTVFDQSSSGSKTLDHDYRETYTVKADGCTTTDTDTVDMHLSGSSSTLGNVIHRDAEGLEISVGVGLSGEVTTVWNYPCVDNSGNETTDRSENLFRWMVFPILIDFDAPETLVGTYTDTVVTPTVTETEASRMELTVTETLEISWNLQSPP